MYRLTYHIVYRWHTPGTTYNAPQFQVNRPCTCQVQCEIPHLNVQNGILHTLQSEKNALDKNATF